MPVFDFDGEMMKPRMNLIFLVDTSGSMFGERINRLNVAMAEAVQIAEETAKKMEIRLVMHVIEFNSHAKWLFGDREDGVSHIDWVPLIAGGSTDTAGAIRLAREVMRREYLGVRNFKPVVILITDGSSNDKQDTLAAIDELKSSLKSSINPTKDKIIRIAIGIGDDVDQEELAAFASTGDFEYQGEFHFGDPYVFNMDSIFSIKQILPLAFWHINFKPIDSDPIVFPVEVQDDEVWDWED